LSRYKILRQEALENQDKQIDAQALPYLRGAVKEGLRLAMPSPTRLPRKVPATGMDFRGYHFPAGVNVGLGSFELHLNPEVFPDPENFMPERWLNPTADMQRDWVPFGMGTRACIARNLAITSVFLAMQQIVEADLLNGAKVLKNRIEIYEWYNSKVVDGRIALIWPKEET
jgi:cytochrome P450